MLYKDVLLRHSRIFSLDSKIGMIYGKEIRLDEEKRNYEIKGEYFTNNPKFLKLKILANYIQFTSVTYLFNFFIQLVLKENEIWYKPHICYGEDKDITSRYLNLISKHGMRVKFDKDICSIYRKSGSDRITTSIDLEYMNKNLSEIMNSNANLM